MMHFDRISLGREAKELGFVRDSFEKVQRLVDVLAFMEEDSVLRDSLALKGGTAINLTRHVSTPPHKNERFSYQSFFAHLYG